MACLVILGVGISLSASTEPFGLLGTLRRTNTLGGSRFSVCGGDVVGEVSALTVIGPSALGGDGFGEVSVLTVLIDALRLTLGLRD